MARVSSHKVGRTKTPPVKLTRAEIGRVVSDFDLTPEEMVLLIAAYGKDDLTTDEERIFLMMLGQNYNELILMVKGKIVIEGKPISPRVEAALNVYNDL